MENIGESDGSQALAVAVAAFFKPCQHRHAQGAKAGLRRDLPKIIEKR
jgi:hypothetical protein